MKRIRVLHVVGRMQRGGVETTLMHILRHIDRSRFHMDFLVHTMEPSDYDNEIRMLDGRVIPCPSPSRPFAYMGEFRQALRDYGPYDIVHSHVHHYSGFILWLAEKAGVPGRIAHSHSNTSNLEARANPVRRIYLRLAVRSINRHATAGLAVSRDSAKALFGPKWESDPRWRVLRYGVDLAPFYKDNNADSVRAEMGISKNAFVVGHVGRFGREKNHRLLIEIIEKAVWKNHDVTLLLVGDGDLRPSIQQQVKDAKLNERVIFAGNRSDVPRLMKAMDVFVLPSLYEGLPVVIIEAQAAGLPCVVSSVVTHEADLIEGLIHRVSLDAPIDEWADRILAYGNAERIVSKADALRVVENSPFSIDTSVRELEKLYLEICK